MKELYYNLHQFNYTISYDNFSNIKIVIYQVVNVINKINIFT